MKCGKSYVGPRTFFDFGFSRLIRLNRARAIRARSRKVLYDVCDKVRVEL